MLNSKCLKVKRENLRIFCLCRREGALTLSTHPYIYGDRGTEEVGRLYGAHPCIQFNTRKAQGALSQRWCGSMGITAKEGLQGGEHGGEEGEER